MDKTAAAMSLGWVYWDFWDDPFVKSYLKAAVSAPPLKPGAFTVADLSASAIEMMVKDCLAFKTENLTLLVLPGSCPSMALEKGGVCFWKVRNDPQGEVFPMRYWGVPAAPLLTKAAAKAGTCRLYVQLTSGLLDVDMEV